MKGRNPKRASFKGPRGGSGSRTHQGGKSKPRGERSQSSPRQSRGRIGEPGIRAGDKARWVVGLHSCHETLKVRPKAVRELWLREDWASSQQLRELAAIAEAKRIQIKPSAVGQLDRIGSGHQGVALAVTESPEIDWSELESPGHQVVLALDGIEDPHNLGSMLRTAWLTGVVAVLIPEDRAVGLTPAVCKVASGGAEHVPVESFSNLPSALQKLKDAGFWVFGLSEKGDRKPWQFDLPEKVVWVIGSEGSGLRVPMERACDELVRVPQVSTGSSYNAAIAAAMALSETCRQFGKPE